MGLLYFKTVIACNCIDKPIVVTPKSGIFFFENVISECHLKIFQILEHICELLSVFFFYIGLNVWYSNDMDMRVYLQCCNSSGIVIRN